MNRLETVPRLSNGYLSIQVTDTGIGISKPDQKKLFKEFGKLKDEDGLNLNGCGLGLTICQKIAKSMNGMISLKSEPGCGSTFTFLFQTYKEDMENTFDLIKSPSSEVND